MQWLDLHPVSVGLGLMVLGALLHLEHRITNVESDVKWIRRALAARGWNGDPPAGKG